MKSEVRGAQILSEIQQRIGLDWFHELTSTEFPPPRPPGTFMAYWSTRDGKPISEWNPSDIIVTLFEKRVLYLQIFHNLSLGDAVGKTNDEFNQFKLVQDEHVCVSCGTVFNPAHNLGQHIDQFGQLDREKMFFRLRRERCSTRCSKLARWKDSVRTGMLPGVEFDESIAWDDVWQCFGPYCYICGVETIYNQEDLKLRLGSRAWKVRWGGYRRGDRDRDAVVEHVQPRSKGGSHTWDNVRIACSKCNLLKGDATTLDN